MFYKNLISLQRTRPFSPVPTVDLPYDLAVRISASDCVATSAKKINETSNSIKRDNLLNNFMTKYTRGQNSIKLRFLRNQPSNYCKNSAVSIHTYLDHGLMYFSHISVSDISRIMTSGQPAAVLYDGK